MVSLVELSEVTEEGVKFKSPYDGKEILLSPEKSISIQNSLGLYSPKSFKSASSTLFSFSSSFSFINDLLKRSHSCLSVSHKARTS